MTAFNFNDYQIESINEERLPVVLALDISSSMSADNRIGSLNKAVNRYLDDVKADDAAASLTDIAIVTFNHEIAVYQDWCPATAAKHVSLTASGGTDIDGAVKRAIEMGRERAHLTEDIGGHVKVPIVILITDAEGTVSEETVRLITDRAEEKTNIWFFGVPGYSRDVAQKITRGVRCFESTTTADEGFNQFFNLMAEVTKTVSTSAPGTPNAIESNPLEAKDNVLAVPDLNDWL